MVLRTSHGNLYVATPDHEHRFDDLRALTDAEVEIRGIVLLQNRWRKFTGYYLLPFGENGISEIAPPPCPGEIKQLSSDDFNAVRHGGHRGGRRSRQRA